MACCLPRSLNPARPLPGAVRARQPCWPWWVQGSGSRVGCGACQAAMLAMVGTGLGVQGWGAGMPGSHAGMLRCGGVQSGVCVFVGWSDV